jgi:quercetin dioxygenase-like cupin family protein
MPPPNPITAAMIFHRDGIKVSRVMMDAGSELPVHSVDDDVVVVVARGVGIFYAQQEPRHVEAGAIVDLVPGEQHSVECLEEMEFVICQMSLASRAVVQPPPPPAG